MYNTGSPVRGFRNGYVRKVQASAQHVVPALGGARLVAPAPERAVIPEPPERAGEGAATGPEQAQPAPPQPAEWDVFARPEASTHFVFSRPQAREPAGFGRQERPTYVN
jgi:type IV secretion system protein VirB1